MYAYFKSIFFFDFRRYPLLFFHVWDRSLTVPKADTLEFYWMRFWWSLLAPFGGKTCLVTEKVIKRFDCQSELLNHLHYYENWCYFICYNTVQYEKSYLFGQSNIDNNYGSLKATNKIRRNMRVSYLWREKMAKAVRHTMKCNPSEKENNQHNVGERGRDVHHLKNNKYFLRTN